MSTQNNQLNFDVFFSYNSKDRIIVERIAKQLKEKGINVFFDKWYLTPGVNWMITLEEILMTCKSVTFFIGPNGIGNWQQRERGLALERQVEVDNFHIIPVILPEAKITPSFLSQNTWIDFRNKSKEIDIVEILYYTIKGKDNHPIPSNNKNVISPYLGLKAFHEEDADFFFGREKYTSELYEKIKNKKFVAVVGSSGSGKSSIARAGLFQKLRHDKYNTWEIVSFFPGKFPIKSLVNALSEKLCDGFTEREWLIEKNAYVKDILEGKISVTDIGEMILDKQPGTKKLLIFVDQWEELYTQASDINETTYLINNLLLASKSKHISIVITLRSDFFGQVLSYRPLADELEDSLVSIGPMTQNELRSAIIKPAERVNLKFEDGLLDRILEDVGNDPGNLPLLEFAITELWQLRTDNLLTHQAYNSLGKHINYENECSDSNSQIDIINGVKGALAKKAEVEYEKLSEDKKQILKDIFTQHLVIVGNGVDDTRRRARFDEIDEDNQKILEDWISARLLIAGFEDNKKTIEV